MVRPKSVIAALLAGAALAGSDADAALNKNGSEYRILPSLPGDQVQAQLALGAHGGFLIVQDNSIDGNGLGIRARKFNADLSAAQNTFQVNARHLGDQKNGRVALLHGGGAVFAWEASTAEGLRVFLRFLDGQDVLGGDDVAASSSAAGSQSNPALAVLPGGNVVVVWAEWDRDGSMDGIFGQIFTPAGIRSGGVFQVNEKSALSQRSPAVTALDGGGFAVAWITDENRHPDSIDVYARVFGASGAPAGAEFPVNSWRVRLVEGQPSELREVCANPVLGRIPGGFRAAWSERSSDRSSESWDVVTRTFDTQGEALSGEVIVNNTRQGDQFSPRLASSGETEMIVWTSFGQDGADEGIFARLIEAGGGFAGDEFQVNTRTISKQIFPAVSGAGAGKYVVAWSSFVGGVASYDLFAQNYSLSAPAGPPQPAVPFVSALSQNSVAVTWADAAFAPGTLYLVYVDDEPSPSETTLGMMTVTRAGWAPGSSHSVRLAYKSPDGKISGLSDAATVVTWGADLNGDGLPDDWQQLNFGKLRPAGKDDTDGDGATNYEEFLAGTDPTDPESVLRTQIVSREQGLYVEWNTVPGSYYQLQVTSDFKTWSNAGTPRFAHSGLDSMPCTGPGQVRYYRVIRMR